MKLLKSSLLGSAAAFAAIGAAHAADLPVKKAVPIEYVRVCSAYGAGFFYIPGTDTCIRISGRARGEVGFQTNESRAQNQTGDVSLFRSLLRINMDARTQTDYGTLRAFIRLEAASRTGAFSTSGTQQRIANAFPALGQDQFSRAQQYVNVDKAFIQFAGLTAGRASSFFDFYAHDFEFFGGTAGSDVSSTNLLAYTATVGNGFSATISLEDPNFRKNTVYSAAVGGAAAAVGTSSAQVFTLANALSPLILATDAAGNATSVAFQDVIERSRMPDFVGALRYDAAFGSAQLSAAVKDVNIGSSSFNSFLGTAQANPVAAFAARGIRGGPTTTEGFAVQGGLKINLPFIAPGDSFYLQGAYGQGANVYTGVTAYSGTYASSVTPTNGGPFAQYLADASLNPLTGKLQLAESLSVVGSFLHYWTPALRSALFASYSQTNFGRGARAAESLTAGLVGGAAGSASFITNPGLFALSPVLRDNYQILAGASLIWSPVKDLDIGVEGNYINTGMQSGRVIDQSKTIGVTSANFNTLLAAGAIKTVNNYDAAQVRFRVQRDF
ncbi:porin [Methylobacterium sp. J-077]|uniref:porin n=1 Tax=Methylobacterium sp. J-077 TaxID=2836656 RepID=UPI001FB87102|nr:porin [Methylobacterium sp. J-077]MCJ2123607.1 porin [Methylobacterium sp. J-077]